MQEYIFIYDHSILRGQEDTDFDPNDAIMYFYPPSTSEEYQHSLCSHVMGTCQILTNIFQSSPTEFSLDNGAKVACIHEPTNGLLYKSNRTITFAIYSDSMVTVNLQARCNFLFESFIFYLNKCINCIFAKCGRLKSKSVTFLFDRLMELSSSKDKLSSIFNLSPYCKPYDKVKVFDLAFHEKVKSFMNSVKEQASKMDINVLGGCLFHKSKIISTQLPTEITNLFSIIIHCVSRKNETVNGEIFNTIKWTLVNINELKARNGIYILKVCLTYKRYCQLKSLKQKSEFLEMEDRCYCCDKSHCHYVMLYLEHHSETTVIFAMDICNSKRITQNVLRIFSNTCFNTLGDLEAIIWMRDSEDSVNSIMRESVLNLPSSLVSQSSWSTTTTPTTAATPIVTTTTTTTTTTTVPMALPVSNGSLAGVAANEWNMVYDENRTNLHISVSGSGAAAQNINNTPISADWKELLIKRTLAVHELMVKEPEMCEIQVKMPKESISVIRSNDGVENKQIFSIKKFN